MLGFALLALFAQPAQTSKALDLDADEETTEPATAPEFTIPVKIHGKEVECGFWKGQDPADVAIEFGSRHELDGKKIGRLRKAIEAEAVEKGLIAATPVSVNPYTPEKEKYNEATGKSIRTAEGLSVATFNDRFAQMQVATIKFAHSPFCQKFCTKENGSVLGIAMLIALGNVCWALTRYKNRREAVKQKLQRLEEQREQERERQKQLFENCVSSAEADALRGAFKNQINAIKQQEARMRAQEPRIKWGWPDWGSKKPIRD